jgi:hypothetical protein
MVYTQNATYMLYINGKLCLNANVWTKNDDGELIINECDTAF